MKKAVKRVVITGVARGLGRALVDFFVAEGVTVCGCSRNLKELNALNDKYRSPHTFTKVDVRDDASVRRWAARELEIAAVPDMLINNAAMIAPNKRLWELTPGEVDPVFDTNIKGMVNVIRHYLPAMIAKGQGRIVNMSSGWGRSASPDVAVYCASKWAVEGLTASLSQEMPEGMAAVSLNPGVICTEMLRSCFGEAADSYPSPEEWVKRAGPFLLSLGAKDNGKALTVPGAEVGVE